MPDAPPASQREALQQERTQLERERTQLAREKVHQERIRRQTGRGEKAANRVQDAFLGGLGAESGRRFAKKLFPF